MWRTFLLQLLRLELVPPLQSPHNHPADTFSSSCIWDNRYYVSAVNSPCCTLLCSAGAFFWVTIDGNGIAATVVFGGVAIIVGVTSVAVGGDADDAGCSSRGG